MNFLEFPKMARLNREVVVTEKIDGTNGQVHILDRREVDLPPCVIVGDFAVAAGSRTRYVTPDSDNYGFAHWVYDHAEELTALGHGRHFGEWWGQGIQRRYGLTEKRFSLFNVHRWGTERPACCHVVPVLWQGALLDMPSPPDFTAPLGPLHLGSVAAPGFKNPEGIVVFHVAAGTGFKYTFDKNDKNDGHKGNV